MGDRAEHRRSSCHWQPWSPPSCWEQGWVLTAFHDCRGVIPSPSHGPLWMRKFLHPSWLICGVFNMNGGSEDRNVLPGPRRPTFLIYLRFSMGPSTKGDSMQLLSDLSEARAMWTSKIGMQPVKNRRENHEPTGIEGLWVGIATQLHFIGETFS